MGTFTPKARKVYQNICHLSERGVLSYMKDLLVNKYGKENVMATPYFVVAFGTLPVALVAHADTVFKAPPSIENFFYDQEKDVIWNPDGAGADDRAGIFAITWILKTTQYRPHIIITTGEEKGCIGAGKLIAAMHIFPRDLRFLVQLDRRGRTDSVFYDCDNVDFENYVNQFGFKTEWGSFSDISVLAPTWKVAAVNLSIGYVDEHNEIERLHVDWMFETIAKVVVMLADVTTNLDNIPVFQYIEAPYPWKFHFGHSAWYDYDDSAPVPHGYDHCFMCNSLEKREDTLPVWYPKGLHPYSLCMDCYSELVNQIVWCKECNRGIFLSTTDAKQIPDVNNWICEDCKNGLQHDSEAVRPRVTVQSGYRGESYSGPIQSVGEVETVVYTGDEISDLRDGYASDL